MNSPAADKHHIFGIDSLRALAVLAVVVYHVQPRWLPGGFNGVDIFFVISGYVVAASLDRSSASTLSQFVLTFYARRLVRLYPALTLCLLASFLAAVLFIPASWLSTTTWWVGLQAFIGVSNIGLVWLDDGYFSPRAEFNPFTHTWSLGVEEQFYVVFPLLAYGWLKARSSSVSRLSVLALAALTMASLVFSAWSSVKRPDLAFYLLPSRFWELALGVALLGAHRRGYCLPKTALQSGICLLLGGTALAAGLLHPPQGGFPLPWALIPVGGAALAICAAASSRATGAEAVRWCLERPLFLYIGRLSYSMYLWHWPVLVLLRWTTGLESIGSVAVALVLTGALAALSYHLVELPTQRWFGAATTRPVRLLGRGWALVAGVAVACVGLIAARPMLSLTTPMKAASDWYPNAHGSRLPKDTAAARRLWVVGDSHAGAYAPMLEQFEKDSGARITMMWSAGCTALAPTKDPCRTFVARAMERLAREAKTGDVVFLPGLRGPRLSDQWTAFDYETRLLEEQSAGQLAAWQSAVSEARDQLQPLLQRGVRVLVELPKPVLPAPVFRCVDWFNRSNPVCRNGLTLDRGQVLRLSESARAALLDLQRQLPGLALWDPFPILCPGTRCRAIDPDGRPIFFDGDHLSRWGNEMLYPSFAAAIGWPGQVPVQPPHRP